VNRKRAEGTPKASSKKGRNTKKMGKKSALLGKEELSLFKDRITVPLGSGIGTYITIGT